MKTTTSCILVCLIVTLAVGGGRAQTVVPETYAVDVSVASTWTSTPHYIAAGDTLIIFSSGAVGANDGDWRDWSGPDGGYPTVAGGCTDCPLPGYPARALVARIGGGPAFFVGSFTAVTADTSGVLRVGVNENSPNGLSGTLRAFIWRRGDTPSGAGEDGSSPPATAVLHQNVPNPFNPLTTIRYELTAAAHVRLVVYDVAGRHVRTLVDGRKNPDQYSIEWNGRNDRGEHVATGVYFYRLEAGSYASTKKMLLLK